MRQFFTGFMNTMIHGYGPGIPPRRNKRRNSCYSSGIYFYLSSPTIDIYSGRVDEEKMRNSIKPKNKRIKQQPGKNRDKRSAKSEQLHK
jgi:hypothetical protein